MKTTVMIPTYKEAGNIGSLLKEILATLPDATIIVVDDDSPDGTASIVADMAGGDERIRLLLRNGERGRGLAGAEGFRLAAATGCDFVVEMDGDFSHHPRYISDLIRAAESADVVIGSRLVAGGGEIGRNPFRKWLTKMANFYIRSVLGLKVRDCTSGYRCFRRKALEAIRLERLRSKGPWIVEEVLYLCHLNRFKIAEIPIIFEQRRAGSSNLNWRKLLTTLAMIIYFRLKLRNG